MATTNYHSSITRADMNSKPRFTVGYNVIKNGEFHRNATVTLHAGVTPTQWLDTANRSYAGMISNGLTEDVYEANIQSISLAA